MSQGEINNDGKNFKKQLSFIDEIPYRNGKNAKEKNEELPRQEPYQNNSSENLSNMIMDTAYKLRRLFTSSSLFLLAFLFTLFHLSVPFSLYAQDLPSGLAPTFPSPSAASYYYIAKPGELTFQVNVWGYVKNPGRYEVPSSTDLIQLISYAGGPSENAKLSEVKITRVVGKDSIPTRSEIVVNLDHLSSIDGESLGLLPGDTIFIDRTSWSTFRDTFTFVTTLGIVATAIAQIIIAVGK
ncbi:MAG: SLBB domain-containing protein [Ignavibacteriae bacterium]|nr:SLBB domain-containing protein [Ignavibacteriota bacterium]